MTERTAQKNTTDFPIFHIPEILVVLAFYGLEALRASTSGDPLPVGIVYFPLGGLGVLASYLLLMFIVDQTLRGGHDLLPWLVSLLATFFVSVKLITVGELDTIFLTAIYLAGPFVVVAGAEPGRFRNLAYRRGWAVILTLLAIVSTDAVRIAWRWTGGWNLTHLLGGIAIAGLIGLATWAFLRIWGDVRRVLHTRWKSSITVAGVGLMLIGGLWHATWTPRILQQGTDDFTPAQTASFDNPALPPEKSVRDLPNIILISIDTLRWDMVPPRAEDLRLPALQRLRKDSLVFQKAFSTSGWTLPAHASLFSGVLSIQHGAMLPHNWIYRSLPLYPQYLRKLGFQTAVFTDAGYVSKVYGFCRGIDLCWEQKGPFPGYPYTGFVPGGLELAVLLLTPFDRGPSLAFQPAQDIQMNTRRYFSRNLNAAQTWLEHRGNNAKPFFIFLHTFEVHDAGRIYPKSYRRLQRKDPELAAAVAPSETSTSSPAKLRYRAKKRLYEYGIEAMDQSLGKFIDWMKRRELYDETLLVFFSDHGEGFNIHHGIKGHGGHVREVLTRVPLWIKFPDGQFADQTVNSFVQLSDVFPITFRHLGLRLSGDHPVHRSSRTWKQTSSVMVPNRKVVPTSVAWKIESNKSLPPEKKQAKLAIRGPQFKIEKLRGHDTGTFWKVEPLTLQQKQIDPDEIPEATRQTLRDHWRRYRDLYHKFPNPFLRDNPTLTDPIVKNLRGLGYMK